MPRNQTATTTFSAETPPASLPNADILKFYAEVSPDLPVMIVEEWRAHVRRSFSYAMVSLVMGGVLATSIVVGFVYLVMSGLGAYAVTLLGAGGLGMVVGLRAARK